MADIIKSAASIPKDAIEAIDKGASIFNRIAKKFQKVEIVITNFLGQAIEVSLSRCNNGDWVTIQNRNSEDFEFRKRLMGTTICKCQVIRYSTEGQRFLVYGGHVPKKLYYTYEIHDTHLEENKTKMFDWGEWAPLHSNNLRVDKTAAENFVQQLINAGDNLNEETLVELRTHQFSAQILDIILEKVGVNFRNSGGITLLHMAADSGYLDAVKALIARDPSIIDVPDKYYQRPIHLAAERGHHEILFFLLKNNADPNALAKYEDDDEDTLSSVSPLHLATRCGRMECVTLLLEREANKEQKDSGLWTPLHYACFNGHLGVVKLLLENGANINAKTENGSTPFHLACSSKNPELVTFLLDKGAKINK